MTAPLDARAARQGSRISGDLVAALLILASAAFELGMREVFYRISSEMPGLFMLGFVTLLLTAIGCLAGRPPQDRPMVRRLWRGMVVVAVAVWTMTAGGQLLPPAMRGFPALLMLIALGGLAVWRLDAPRWAAVRRAATASALIFVLSQPLLASWHVTDVRWPPVPPVSGTATPGAALTVVVLLDELSYRAAGPIATAMRRSGRPVSHESLLPSGDSTAKVVPSLFTQQPFEQAKPCGWNTVCSGTMALDFDRILASRSDVDVVGFYMPYCAIQGLRSCEVLAPDSPYADLRRWWCAAQRRSVRLARLGGETVRAECAEMGGRVWAWLGARTEAAIWRAPVWERGGLLYVHMPLPHPPGKGGAGTLGQHYRANIDKAASLVGAMADRLRKQQRSFRLVVFSDHPLRSSVWCDSTQYRDHGCPLPADLRDEHVPLLVTSSLDTPLPRLQSNTNIFGLVGAVPTAPASKPAQ